MMNQGLVSFIVPIYKAERYIHKCIDSLLAQTYTDIEVILVDDGSPDNCGVICDDYAARDKRVKVIHQQNGGVSAARNTGLWHAVGDYVAFIDADDQVTNDYIEKLSDNNADLIIGGYKDTGNHTFTLSEGRYVGKDGLIEFYSTHFHRLYSTVPWGKLYKWSIIQENKLSFDTRIRLGEDIFIVFPPYHEKRARPVYNQNVLMRSAIGGKKGYTPPLDRKPSAGGSWRRLPCYPIGTG